MDTKPDPSLREPEAASLLGLAPDTLRHLRMKGGGPPYLKLGRAVRYPQDKLLVWRDARLRSSTSDPGQCGSRTAAQ